MNVWLERLLIGVASLLLSIGLIILLSGYCTSRLPTLEATSLASAPAKTPAAYPPSRTSRTATVRSARACAARSGPEPAEPDGSGGNGGCHRASVPSPARTTTSSGRAS